MKLNIVWSFSPKYNPITFCNQWSQLLLVIEMIRCLERKYGILEMDSLFTPVSMPTSAPSVVPTWWKMVCGYNWILTFV